MGMLATGTKTILQIETEDFCIYVSGKTENEKFKAINSNLNMSSYVSVKSDVYIPSVKTIDDDDYLVENNTNSMRPSFFEDGTYNIYLENKSDKIFDIYHNDKEIRQSMVLYGKNIIGNIKFNGDIGYCEFKIKNKNVEVMNFIIEVFPSKLDYIKDYKEMLREVNEEITSLVFDFLGKTFKSVDFKETKNQSNVEFLAILRSIYTKLERAINRIQKHPKHGVFNNYYLKDKDKCKRISTKETIKHLRKNPSSTKAIEVKKVTTLDIYENQYIKYMIKNIIKRIRELKRSIYKKYQIQEDYYRLLDNFEGRLTSYLNTFFRDISDLNNNKSMTLVFKMASGYKEIYFYYTLLQKGLDVYEGLYNITPKKLWNLYEIWCYIKLHNILREIGYNSYTQSIIQATSNGITLSLMQNKESKGIYQNKEGKKIELWYNKCYSNLPTTNQKPDTVLCLRDNSRKDRIYIFDAKYRLHIDDNNIIGPMEEDINVMHRYRDSIVSEMEDSMQFRYNTFGAYVMFPYSDEEKFKEHKFYKSIEKVNIGAFPMLPGSTSLIRKHLCNILNLSYIEAKNTNPIFDESEDYYKFKNENVMIVNVKDIDHLQSYKNNKFYHIPVSTLSNVRIGIEYLAFYQPKKSFGNESGIHYYAKIKKYYKYKRKQCTELSCNKSKEDLDYYRFETEEWQKIGPIAPVEYGTRNVSYTTLYLLNKADTMHELKLKSRVEIDTYKILKEVSKIKNVSLIKQDSKFKIGNDFVQVTDKNNIILNGQKLSLDNLKSALLESNIAQER
ncbi:hypothetical protein SAMN05661008_01952 [Alkalithermobacter thermoalcaliphilus JW-YL-7 = DSM 7308]|uniref:DUF2357 domain-containing protein n=1 Tax=Alkalithermobacter thermoalcaliphilus JW-YL-7 = DSM 7308 TaxID=1121328 RepID=A0A150FQW2_CLOPD|nr:protein of unknown function DUF2357-containing protein [[Clostridium] paradoxum JW-YL-7 = DSM 7308]SHL37469.1 hypothetical protein SAMN05661008_01952 [[Clostridium] paradoxum JW-YL-7 = DSM 7308]